MLSTHIPQTGPLTPEAVDASFARAHRFFGQYFPEYPTTDLHCGSWLLDPQLVDGLPERSNMARFGRRWRLYGEPLAGDEDALFFTFHRRGDVDLNSLPRDTSLQRLIIDHLTGRSPLARLARPLPPTTRLWKALFMTELDLSRSALRSHERSCVSLVRRDSGRR